MTKSFKKRLKKVFNKNYAPEIAGLLILIITFSNLSFNNRYLQGNIINTAINSSSIKYGVSSYQVDQNQDISLQVELPAKNYIAVVINVIGDNNYVRTLYYYCHQNYTNDSCTKIQQNLLIGPITINETWTTTNVQPGKYKIVITTINDIYQKEKVETPTINVTRQTVIKRDLSCSNYFADMSESHPLCNEVTFLRKNGIFMGQEVRGKRVANLNSYLIRSEFFAVAERLYDKDERYSYYRASIDSLLRFDDIDVKTVQNRANHWWLNAVLNLDGIVSGYSDNTLRPNQTLTMAELAKITALATNYISYFDENKQPWYRDIVNAYRAENIYFDPRVSVRRADAVRLIYDTLMLTGEGISRYE